MSCVEPPDPVYTPRLPHSLLYGERGFADQESGWSKHEPGALSAAQLEALVYAGQRHSCHNGDGERSGFFVGDGTGVGKGRELAAIIWENWIRGRRRAVWFTCNTDLLVDAERDLRDVGCKHIAIKSLSSMGYGPIARELKEGVLLVTYSCLIAHSGTGG